MTNEFPIIIVTEEAYKSSTDEALGSKYKFWYQHEKLGRCLYKQARANSGEDWAEKIASELCKLLVLPHATYELALTSEGNRGVVSPDFLSSDSILVHGNELLTSIVPNYPTFGTYGISQHTIDVVLMAINNESINLPIGWSAISSIQAPVDVFVGYLLLDAWIGNGDRHHENWAIVRKIESTLEQTEYLAPTYNHASCLGRDLSDEQRQQRSVESYTNKSFSAFYGNIGDKKPLKTFDVFQQVVQSYPDAANIWLAQLESISEDNIKNIFNLIPRDRLSSIAADFAQKILRINKQKLVNLRE
ncbi:HipA-like protein [Dulcicalothrix desertica]|nr:HipA-like protein [Dulcicalothrix desertica]